VDFRVAGSSSCRKNDHGDVNSMFIEVFELAERDVCVVKG
jgi:hypothetical protein